MKNETMKVSFQTIDKAPVFERRQVFCHIKKERTRSSCHGQPLNVLNCRGQEALFAHILDSEHSGEA